jgi:hypothetical protein
MYDVLRIAVSLVDDVDEEQNNTALTMFSTDVPRIFRDTSY